MFRGMVARHHVPTSTIHPPTYDRVLDGVAVTLKRPFGHDVFPLSAHAPVHFLAGSQGILFRSCAIQPKFGINLWDDCPNKITLGAMVIPFLDGYPLRFFRKHNRLPIRRCVDADRKLTHLERMC